MIPADAVALGMRLPSVANLREHWAAKARRTGHHRRASFALTRSATSEAERSALVAAGCVVTLTRQAPRALDNDNLAAAFKAVRDGVAAALGIDDRDPRVRWAYAQERGPAAVRIRLEPASAARQPPAGELSLPSGHPRASAEPGASKGRKRPTAPGVIGDPCEGVTRDPAREKAGRRNACQDGEDTHGRS